MAKAVRLEFARMVFAKITGALEDATLVVAEGQTTPGLAAARQSCDGLIAVLDVSLKQLQQLRRQLE
jgi:hypothetical protein